MITPQPHDAIHKAWLMRLLSAIYDNQQLSATLYFKGGTCAAMRDLLDRFSIDLDFDYVGKKPDMQKTKKALEQVFSELGLTIKDSSKKVPQYFLLYPSNKGKRNTIKIDVTTNPPKTNTYEPGALGDIDRITTCQTIETMFANKLVALMDRYEKHQGIAGRDLYDIHYFFMQGYRYNIDVIKERTGKEADEFFELVLKFIQKHITQTIINQDLNILLEPKQFQRIRKVLKQETIGLLGDELERIKVTPLTK